MEHVVFSNGCVHGDAEPCPVYVYSSLRMPVYILTNIGSMLALFSSHTTMAANLWNKFAQGQQITVRVSTKVKKITKLDMPNHIGMRGHYCLGQHYIGIFDTHLSHLSPLTSEIVEAPHDVATIPFIWRSSMQIFRIFRLSDCSTTLNVRLAALDNSCKWEVIKFSSANKIWYKPPHDKTNKMTVRSMGC